MGNKECGGVVVNDFDKQVAIYRRLQRVLGWRELRGFQSSAPGGGFDGWIQRRGIAIWINPSGGLQIGYKNRVGNYSPLTGLEKREKLTLEQAIAAWTKNMDHGSVAPELRFRLAVIITLIRSELEDK